MAKQAEHTENSGHLYWVDMVRVVAVFQVILVHLAYPVFFKDDLPRTYWYAANFYDSLSRMGVPLFFMVSGVLLLRRTEPTGAFLKKRLIKVGVPTIFWSAFYLWWSVEAYRTGSMTPFRIMLSMLKAIYLGDVEIHLWFLYILIGIYLVVPILRLLVRAASRRDLGYFLAMWFISTPLIELATRATGLPLAFNIPVVAGYVGYFMMGYFLAEINMTAGKRALAISGIAIAVVATYFGTNLLSVNVDTIDAFFYSYFSLPTVLASFCGFLLLKDLGQRQERTCNAVKALSAESFGIYLIHILVIDLLRRGFFGFRLFSWIAPPAYMIPLTALVVYLVSFGIIFLLRKIPVVRLLVP